jgi:micrococcal nuclease
VERLPALLLALLAVFTGCATTLPATPAPGDGTVGTGGGTVAPGAGITPSGGATNTVTVTRVVDGDTMYVSFENGTEDTVRLLGVDTPETRSESSPDEFEGVPDTDAGRECLGRYGDRASAFATGTLEGKAVTLQLEPDSDRRGYYGRLLGYLVVDGQNFNYRLVAEGHARVYDSSFSLKEEFYAAESGAQSAGTGVWSCTDGATGPTATVSPTPDGGASAAVLPSSASTPTRGGTTTENLNDEYATLTPGDRVTLHTGSGEDTATGVYWGQSSAVWNNGGDTVTVSDDDGDVVAERSY